MKQIKFKIIGNPVPKGRPRFYKAGNFVHSYTPKKTRQWEQFVKFQAIHYRPKELWTGAIVMDLVFWLPRPKSLPKKVINHIKKPDIENLAKSVMDALEGIIYKRDSQIICLVCDKIYSETEYGVDVKLTELDGE